MIKGFRLIAVLVGVFVLAVAGWQALPGGESAASVREEAAQNQEASPEPEVTPSDGGSVASAPEDSPGTTQTKRLAVDNILQVGGFGCVSCQGIVAATLQKSDGVEEVAYESETDTYLVTFNDDFRMDEVAEEIRSISAEYNRRLGLPDSPDWVLKEV